MRLTTTILSIALTVSNPVFAQETEEHKKDPYAPKNLVERVHRCENTLDKCAAAWMQQKMYIGVQSETISVQDAQIKDITSALIDARKRSIFERPEIIIPLSVVLGFGVGALVAK